MQALGDHDLTVRALDALENEKPEQHRMLMFALEHPGMTHDAIAAVFACTRVNVTRTIQRARRNLDRFKARYAAETQKA